MFFRESSTSRVRVPFCLCEMSSPVVWSSFIREGVARGGSAAVSACPWTSTRSPPPGTWIASQRQSTRHVVARGETLGGIANRYQVTLSSLRQVNKLPNDVILVGTELLIPTS